MLAMIRLAFGAFVIAIGFTAAPVFAQGFQVKPMQMDVIVAAGRVSETVLELANTTLENLQLDIRPVALTQNEEGSWQIVPDDAEADASVSAVPLTAVEFDRVEIAPSETARVRIRFSPPPGARGTYVGGLIAEQPPRPDATGLTVRVRFLIPVILQIDGRPVRQQVALNDVAMDYLVSEETGRGTTFASVKLANDGRTFSKLHGEVTVSKETQSGWRVVTRYPLRERSIIPGAKFDLREDLARSLPSGVYRVRAELYVDGRRIAPLERDIDFIGDPNMDAVAFDTTVVLEPEMVVVDARPGAVRTTTVTITNPGDAPVEMRMEALTPNTLQNVVMGAVSGRDLSAAPWTEIRPSEFTIRPKGRQNVRVLTALPRDASMHANYYADLMLRGRYSDGQSAGETRSIIKLTNANVETRTAVLLERLSLSTAAEPGKYAVMTQMVNTGNVDVSPEVRIEVLDGRTVLAGLRIQASDQSILPLGLRDFSAELDLSAVDPGRYLLRAIVFEKGVELARRQGVLDLQAAAGASEGEDELGVELTLIDDPSLVDDLATE